MEAAKRKTFWLSLLALACVFSTPIFASSVDVLQGKTRAELSAETGQSGIERSPFYPGKHVETYDIGWRTASDSPVAPNSAGRQKWFNFLADRGGETVPTGYGAAYGGNLSWANRLGLRQGYSTTIRNFDSAGSWFARTDTAVHEGFHALVAKHLPSVWKAGDATLFKIPVGAPIKYVEEVFAYAAGHGGALRLHGIPFAPIEAFGSLTARESITTIIFGIGGYGIYEYFND